MLELGKYQHVQGKTNPGPKPITTVLCKCKVSVCHITHHSTQCERNYSLCLTHSPRAQHPGNSVYGECFVRLYLSGVTSTPGIRTHNLQITGAAPSPPGHQLELNLIMWRFLDSSLLSSLKKPSIERFSAEPKVVLFWCYSKNLFISQYVGFKKCTVFKGHSRKHS